MKRMNKWAGKGWQEWVGLVEVKPETESTYTVDITLEEVGQDLLMMNQSNIKFYLGDNFVSTISEENHVIFNNIPNGDYYLYMDTFELPEGTPSEFPFETMNYIFIDNIKVNNSDVQISTLNVSKTPYIWAIVGDVKDQTGNKISDFKVILNNKFEMGSIDYSIGRYILGKFGGFDIGEAVTIDCISEGYNFKTEVFTIQEDSVEAGVIFKDIIMTKIEE